MQGPLTSGSDLSSTLFVDVGDWTVSYQLSTIVGTPSFTATHTKGAVNTKPACLTQQAANSPSSKELDSANLWAETMISGKLRDGFLSFDRECHIFVLWEWGSKIPVKSMSKKWFKERSQSWGKKGFLVFFFFCLFGFVVFLFFLRYLRALLAAPAVPDLHRLFRLDSGYDFWK